MLIAKAEARQKAAPAAARQRAMPSRRRLPAWRLNTARWRSRASRPRVSAEGMAEPRRAYAAFRIAKSADGIRCAQGPRATRRAQQPGSCARLISAVPRLIRAMRQAAHAAAAVAVDDESGERLGAAPTRRRTPRHHAERRIRHAELLAHQRKQPAARSCMKWLVAWRGRRAR